MCHLQQKYSILTLQFSQKTFLSGEKIEEEMVLWAEGSSVKRSPQQGRPLALMLREGPTLNSRITEIYGQAPG